MQCKFDGPLRICILVALKIFSWDAVLFLACTLCEFTSAKDTSVHRSSSVVSSSLAWCQCRAYFHLESSGVIYQCVHTDLPMQVQFDSGDIGENTTRGVVRSISDSQGHCSLPGGTLISCIICYLFHCIVIHHFI